jgi:hypothetical protein
MKRIIRLTENELTSMIKKMVLLYEGHFEDELKSDKPFRFDYMVLDTIEKFEDIFLNYEEGMSSEELLNLYMDLEYRITEISKKLNLMPDNKKLKKEVLGRLAKLDNTKKFKDESYYFSEIIDMIDNGELLDKLGLTELYENNNNRK